jgi:hypothetical protein
VASACFQAIGCDWRGGPRFNTFNSLRRLLNKAVFASGLGQRVCEVEIQHAWPVLNNSRQPQVVPMKEVAAREAALFNTIP